MAYDNRLNCYQGNSKTIFCSIYDSSNNTMDLTGYSGLFSLKSKVPNSSVILTKIGVLDSSALSFTFTLTPIDTSLAVGDYFYNIDISSNTEYKTIVADRFSVLDANLK